VWVKMFCTIFKLHWFVILQPRLWCVDASVM
jgi:hypothetical protein